jgi:hypothetical protein
LPASPFSEAKTDECFFSDFNLHYNRAPPRSRFAPNAMQAEMPVLQLHDFVASDFSFCTIWLRIKKPPLQTCDKHCIKFIIVIFIYQGIKIAVN